MICQNCKAEFRGNFCNTCGQKSSVTRIDSKYVLNEIPSSVFQLDRGFLFTVKELIFRPGHSIREFLEGKRKQHYKPIAFLLVTATLYILSAYLMNRNSFMLDAITGFAEGGAPDFKQSKGADILTWISKYEIYFLLLMIPFYSLASYLAFVKSDLNYFEHLVANLFITGLQMLIYFVLGFVFFKENYFSALPIVVGATFNLWAFNQLFESKSMGLNFALVSLSYLIFFIMIFVISVAIVGVGQVS